MILQPPTLVHPNLLSIRRNPTLSSYTLAALCLARRRLALRTKITAAANNNQAPDWRFASITRLSLSAVGAVAELIFARLAFGVKKIADGRAAQSDGVAKNFLQRIVEFAGFLGRQIRGDPFRMNPCLPKAFVGIDIANAAKGALIKQKRFDARFVGFQQSHEIASGYFEWILAEAAKLGG